MLVIAGRPDERIADTRKVDVVIREGRILDRRALRFDARQDPGDRPIWMDTLAKSAKSL